MTSRRRTVLLSFGLIICFWIFGASWLYAAPKKSAPKTAKETITYVIQKGDSVNKIAAKYNVSPDDIARWNNLSNIAHIRIGQKLRLRIPKGSAQTQSGSSQSNAAKKVVQTVSYVVKKGDNLGKIARKTGVSIEQLQKLNRSLKKNPDKLKVGQTLVLRETTEYVGVSGGVSRGLASNGSLSGGIQLKSGPGFIARKPQYSYGTAMTVGLIMDAMAAYAAKFPKAQKFSVGDLSAKNGGRLPPHLSHQSGRDVDITFLRDANGNIDVEKNWFIIEYFLKTKKVQYIFIDYPVQEKFYNYALKHGYSAQALSTVIQFPNGKKNYSAIIRHSKGHASHFHVRFVCAGSDVNCK